MAENPVDTIRLARMFFLGALAITSIAFIFLRRSWNSKLGWGIKTMAGYAIFAMGSFVYSDFPTLSLWKGFEVLAITLAGMMIGCMLKDGEDLQSVLNIIYIALSYLIISSLISAIFNPAEAFTKMQVKGPMAFSLQGIYPLVNANTLSQVSAIICASALIWMIRPERNYSAIGPLIVFFVSFTCLVLSHSRTSIIALLLVTFLILFVYRRIMLLLSLFWLTTLLAISGIIFNYITPYFMRGQKIAVFSTMSGRLEFWPEVLKKIWEAPILGHGFYASQRFIWNISSVDNTYLEVILGIGFVGLILICIPLVSIFNNLWKTRPWNTGVGLNSSIRFLWIQMSCIYFIVFIRSFTGPSFQNLHINLVIFTVLIIGACKLRKLSNSISFGNQGCISVIGFESNKAADNIDQRGLKGRLNAGKS